MEAMEAMGVELALEHKAQMAAKAVQSKYLLMKIRRICSWQSTGR
jgi:hypothetical protein